MNSTLTLLPFLFSGPAPNDQLTIQQVIELVHQDLGKFPPHQRQQLRYLSLHNLPEDRRDYFRATLSGHCNKLSRTSIITPIVPIASSKILRVDLSHYGWPAELWDRLEDPYFTDAVTVEIPIGYYQGTRWIQTRVEKKTTRQMPVSNNYARDVMLWTASRVPIVRADWFFNATAANQDRASGYNDFLGIKDRKTFDARVGYDAARSRGFRFELREATGDSGVATHHVRVIVRDDSLGGAYWSTLDFDNARDAKDALNILGRDADSLKWSATEIFAMSANGLWIVGAFDRKGKSIASVSTDIAADHVSKSNDKRIHVGASCFRCHSNAGLQDVDQWARTILTPPVKINTPDYNKHLELREQYLRSLNQAIEHDRARYESAIKVATGLTAKEDAKRHAELWELYEDAKVTIDRVAADLDITVDDFRKRLLQYLQVYEFDVNRSLSLVAAAFLHEGPRLRTIPIRQYEEALPELKRVAEFLPGR